MTALSTHQALRALACPPVSDAVAVRTEELLSTMDGRLQCLAETDPAVLLPVLEALIAARYPDPLARVLEPAARRIAARQCEEVCDEY